MPILILALIASIPFGPFWSTSNRSQTAAPSLNPTGFTSPAHGPQTVVMSTVTPGANMSYTKDGTTPTPTHGTIITSTSGSTTVPGSAYTDLAVMAFAPGLNDSAVTLGTYDFQRQ